MQKAWAYVSNFSTSIKITAVAIVIVAPLAIFLFGFILNAARINAAYKIPGASQSWNTLLSYAEAAASGVDSDAVLEQVTSDNSSIENRLACPQKYQFYFLKASGASLIVDMADGVTPSVDDIQDNAEFKDAPTAEYRAKLKEALAYARLGPHEICPTDPQDAANYREGPEINLRLDNAARDPQLLHDPSWSIWYQDGINKSINPYSYLFVFVSSQTGQIVKRAGIQ